MNNREYNKIETRVSRVGGEMADLLGVVRDTMPDEYPTLMGKCQEMQDELRRIRRVAQAMTGA